jgi:pyrroline-5-carboxylate reductase
MLDKKDKVNTYQDNRIVAQKAGVLILAVKPQQLKGVLGEIKEYITKDKLVISIAAARTISYLERKLGEDKKIIRAMPNLGLTTRTGATVYAMNNNCTEADAAIMQYIFSKGGYISQLPEKLIDTATFGACLVGLTSKYLDTAVNAMVEQGVDHETATLLLKSALLTTSALVKEGRSFGDIYAQVASPGGLTEAANEYAQTNGMYKMIPKMLSAANTRAKELSTN